MRGIRYSKKIDQLIRKGTPLRSIRKKKRKTLKRKSILDKKGQLYRISNTLRLLVGGVIGFTMFILASPFIKNLIDNTKQEIGAVPGFFITLLPYVIIGLIVIYIIVALRGGDSAD